MMTTATGPADVESAVGERYARAASKVEPRLCCAVAFDKKHLEPLPDEIVNTDYGCGDPTVYCRPGQTVLDLGSGSGKGCYIMSQIVGREGRVIGVDFNDDMLALAEKHRTDIGRRIGWNNVAFKKARIQNLRLDLRRVDDWLRDHPVRDSKDWAALDAFSRRSEAEAPLIASDSVDLIVSNCVLNLVRPEDKAALFAEMYRVLRKGGRAVISDIVSDEEVPERLQRDPELWSGCISGAYREDLFLQAFADAGLHGIEIASRQDQPWRTVAGIEFRSVTVSAYKGKVGPCFEGNQAVMYLGPWSQVRDDDDHVYPRGVRVAVCDKTFNLLKHGPYAANMAFIEPRDPVDPAEARPFDCSRTAPRHPRETKGMAYDATTEASQCCGTDGGCC